MTGITSLFLEVIHPNVYVSGPNIKVNKIHIFIQNADVVSKFELTNCAQCTFVHAVNLRHL